MLASVTKNKLTQNGQGTSQRKPKIRLRSDQHKKPQTRDQGTSKTGPRKPKFKNSKGLGEKSRPNDTQNLGPAQAKTPENYAQTEKRAQEGDLIKPWIHYTNLPQQGRLVNFLMFTRLFKSFGVILCLFFGCLAQLVRAPRLHRGGRRFDPCSTHHLSNYSNQKLKKGMRGLGPRQNG